jgi:Tfp pilus assembly protein PilF
VTVHPQEIIPSAGFQAMKITSGQYFLTQTEVVLHYIQLVIWPRPLVFDYAWPVVDSWQAVWPALAIMAGLLTLSIWALKTAPLWGFLGLSFFIILAPSSSFIPLNDLAFEHRMYLPSVCVILMMISGMRAIGNRLSSRAVRIKTGYQSVVGALILIFLVCLTVERTRDYTSGLRMWQDVVSKRPGNARALNNLATYLFVSGRTAEALPLYRRSLALNPDARAHMDFGHYLYEQGQWEEAKKYFAQALRYDPDYADAHLNLGVALSREGKNEEAFRHYVRVTRLQPDYGAAYNNMGAVLANQGKYSEAISYYEKAIAVGFKEADVLHNLGLAYAFTGQPRQALQNIKEALRINPNSEAARRDIAEIETHLKKEASVRE